MQDTPLPIIDPNARRAFTLHSRLWQSNRYVYPVVSRRSKGISIGVNLNPDKVCNFDCIYCSVDRRTPLPPATLPPTRNIDLPQLREELSHMLALAHSGDLYALDPFDKIPQPLRRINDIAFSGDGEPTTCPQFTQAVHLAADLLQTHSPIPPTQSSVLSPQHSVKLVLITNATTFHHPPIRETLAFLDTHNGEIWAKLDAGTPAYYDLVDRSPFPFPKLLDNLLWSCQTRPTVIQSLFMQIHAVPPPPEEITAFTARLQHILQNQGQIKLLQLYTVARTTTETYATPLSPPQLHQIQSQIQTQLPALPIEIYP